ncbi:MAG: 50S ribosomal protein L24 [Candidatus Roizmanbacteria bacterium]|nr:MAG: 50S ribosomal protein L24 [Candidatus Roizmanbacteria bacterium]
MKIKKGDKVKIIAGKDKGREGIVEKVYKKQSSVVIPKVNIYKKHVKKNEKMPQGGVVEIPRPIDVSNVIIVCPKCNKTSKIGYRVEKNKRIRICKKCESAI